MPSPVYQVAVCTRYGHAQDVIELQEQLKTSPVPGFVRVRMQAAPINPSDLLSCEGHYNSDAVLPAAMGFEGVGIVEASGGGLIGWLRKGQRVAVISRSGGTWGTYCHAESKTVVPIPRQMTTEQGAVYFINPASALLMTQWILQVPRGGWIMQSAANSSVGRMIIRLGRHFDFHTVNVVRSEAHRDELLNLGADVVIVATPETKLPDFTEQLKTETKGILPRYAVDAVAGHTGGLLFNSLGQGGRMLSYGSITHDPIPVQPRQLIVRDRHLDNFFLGTVMQNLSILQKLKLLKQLERLHLQGLFQVEKFRVFPLQEIQEGIAAATTKSGGTKILLQME